MQKSVTVRKSVSDRRTGSVAEASRNSSQTFNPFLAGLQK